MLFAALLMGGASTFVSCTDTESDAVYDLNGQLSKAIEQQRQQLTDINSRLETVEGKTTDATLKELIKNTITENQQTINESALQYTINQLLSGNDKLNDAISKSAAVSRLLNEIYGEDGNSGLKKALSDLQTEVKNSTTGWTEKTKALSDSVKWALTLAQADSIRLNILGDSIYKNAEDIKDLQGRMTDVEKYKEEIDKINNVTIAGLNTSINTIETRLSALEGSKYDDTEIRGLITTLQGDVTTAKTDASNALAKANALETKLTTEINNAKNDVLGQIALTYATKSDIANMVTKDQIADMVTKGDIVDFVTKNELDTKLADYAKLSDIVDAYSKSEIDSKLSVIEADYKSLIAIMSDNFNRLVTGVIVQGSESPFYGYVSTPLGESFNVLGAYYGYADNGFSIGGERGNAGVLLNDADDNAGLIFVNVNPTGVNPEGIKLTLVDSQGNEAPFKLEWANTDRVLTYGGSRAVDINSNGFYAVKVKLDEGKLNEAKTWTSADASELKDAAKNVLDKLRQPSTNRLNVAEIAKSIENVFNNRLTRYAVKATWSIKDKDGNWVEKSTVSRLNLGATAIKPLSFEFLKNGVNVDLPKIPTLESKGMTITDFPQWDPIKGDFEDYHYTYTISVPVKNSIKIDGSALNVVNGELVYKDETKKEITGVTVTVGDINWEDAKVTYDTTDEEIDITVSMEKFNKVIDNLNAQVENLLGYANAKIDKYNKFATTIDKNYISRVNRYIQRFENLLRKSNSLLQPALFGVNSSNFWQLATLPGGANQLKMEGGNAETVLVAASYTAELLAPAYKKCIKVVEKPTGATVSGDNLGKVLNGNVYKVGFKANKPGLYGIQYEAVDYSGKTVKKTYYIKVVE